MVLDGTAYSAIARNLANGNGSFWQPRYTATVHPLFFEHPPLVFGLQSLLFIIFGDSLLIERGYTLLTTVITGGLIVFIWRLLFKEDPKFKKYSWLPLILWLILPINVWSYSNNLLENTMGIFTLAAIALMIKDIKISSVLLPVGAGLMIFIAVFCKGPAGFFPAAFYLLVWLISKYISWRRAVLNSLLVILIPVLAFSLLFLYPPAKNNLIHYISYQIIPSLKGDLLFEDEPRRFFILKILFVYTIPLLFVTFAVFIYGAFKKRLYLLRRNIVRWAILLILTGLSASVPLMITPKQNYNYLIPAIPYFSLGFGIIVAGILNASPGETRSEKSVSGKTGMVLIIILLAGFPYALLQAKRVKSSQLINYKYSILSDEIKQCVCPYASERINREAELLSDIHIIGERLPRGTILSIPESLWECWHYHAYFARFYDISLDKNNLRRLYLCEKGDKPPSEKYRLVPFSTRQLDLYLLR